ncbi:MAG: 3-hydroxyacyl-CoA dehydrogenase NAD-binding domain-containing protein [Legionellales bacterium]|jgi:3-hydroxyacyl-CoA dehydrogenase/enoyl-CoA hydratase/3-hydroxybutyryl-CoA epimerase
MKNWQLNVDDQQIAWLHFNNENNKVNILRTAVVKELNEILDDLKNNPPKALVFLSDKASGFCMGADIHEFKNNTDLDALREYVNYGQAVMQKIADLNFPTIALINGFCLGGGLELSLACRYRIAQEDALLGLPEVRLGVQPAWGGSVRLPQLIHPLKALNMILTGRMIKAYPAKKMGLVDACVPKRQMLNAARTIAVHGLPKRKKQLGHMLARSALIRRLAAKVMRYQVAKQANPKHYPAPFMIIDNWEKYGAMGNEAYAAEVNSFIALLEGDTAKNLVRLFLLQEQLKAAGKKTDTKIQHIHVIGAGTMGGDIAIWCAQKGLTVSLQDRTPQALGRAMAYKLDNLIPDVNGDGLAHADIILEAVFENLDVKNALFNDIKDKIKRDAIVASNTSSISLKEFPYPIVGLHFFNPVAKMQLLEVVHTENLNQDVSDRALAFAHQIGKLPLKVKDCPGFLVNRVIAPYLLESACLLEEGLTPQQLDKIAQDFGMVMGPVAMIDLIGLDVCLAAVKNLGGVAPKVLVDKVARGELGKKSGEGFYVYKNGKTIKPKNYETMTMNPDEVIQRLMLPLINECKACLREKIVETSDEIDAGVIFGMGFAPFRGGPLQYAKTIGL